MALQHLLLLLAIPGISGCLDGCDCSKNSYTCYNFRFPEIAENMFSDYPELSQIVLIGSSLTTLPVGLFTGLSQLQELKMPSNSFKSLPQGIFTGLTRLNRVSLSYNALANLPDELFRDATNLQTLNINNNQLTVFPADMFSYTASLEILDASDNLLSELQPGLLSGLKELRSISLTQNKIPALAPGALKDLGNLQFLDLSNNKIASLPVNSFVSNPKLMTLYLYRNQICSYGTAASPDAILAVIIAEVKHTVDVIVHPQTVRCLPAFSVTVSTDNMDSPSGGEFEPVEPVFSNTPSRTPLSISNKNALFLLFLVIFVLCHLVAFWGCYRFYFAAQTYKQSEFTV